jgi:hypothetical protein
MTPDGMGVRRGSNIPAGSSSASSGAQHTTCKRTNDANSSTQHHFCASVCKRVERPFEPLVCGLSEAHLRSMAQHQLRWRRDYQR